MADLEKVEFEFPDEKEDKKSKVEDKAEEAESEKPEIEVVDDTPEHDRNRSKMVEPPKEFAEDELNKYDESVQKRIKHFTKGYHEERRAKEAIQREKDEALRFAQSMVEENNRLKGTVNQNQSALIEQAKKVVANELEKAKQQYKDAYEAGDSNALVDAQENLTSVKMKAERVNNFKPAPLQLDETDVQTQQKFKEPPIDEKLAAWQEMNPWCGKNKRMSAYALVLHEDLTVEGIATGSDEYYRRIDADIKQRFSEQFGAEENVDA